MLTSHKKWIIFGLAFCLFATGLSLLFYYSPKNNPTVSQPIPIFKKDTTPTTYPAQILNLNNWKLTLPSTTPNSKVLLANIQQPELATYYASPWFMTSPDKKGVIFRAPVNSQTTKNSDYPRSELREMTADGSDEIFWPSTSGIHTLFIEQAITAVPRVKPHVVAGQIHGDDDDLIVIRLEYPKLFIARGRSNLQTLNENYVLGEKFNIKFVANNGRIAVFYNNETSPAYVLEKEVKQAYFKAGVYTQSNCETEDDKSLCSSDNYGEVIIYQLEVTHQ